MLTTTKSFFLENKRTLSFLSFCLSVCLDFAKGLNLHKITFRRGLNLQHLTSELSTFNFQHSNIESTTKSLVLENKRILSFPSCCLSVHFDFAKGLNLHKITFRRGSTFQPLTFNMELSNLQHLTFRTFNVQP